MKNNKAFTLAEVMIVLSVIGILTAILLPIVANSTPDKNVLKFKKADTTLKNAIRELVNSNEYYADGDLGKKPDGSKVDSARYFCETIADVLSTKKVNCSEYKAPDPADGDRVTGSLGHYHSVWNNIELMDNACKNGAKMVGEEIVLSDGTVIYQTSPGHHYNVKYRPDKQFDLFYYRYCFDGTASEACNTVSALDSSITTYKPICIDIDGIPSKGSSDCDDKKDICPFGYAVRVDGKIISGPRAQQWLEKDFQGKDLSEQN